MDLRHLFYDSVYRVGRPIWDIPTPQELKQVVEGPSALPAGRALDLGCGTSPNVAYLAQHGWQAIGVDFSETAINKARQDAKDIPGATFVVADVRRLRESGITGPFDLVVDNGCYHTLSEDGKLAYVREIAAIMPPGARLMMWEVALVNHPLIRVRPNEIRERFSGDFDIQREEVKHFVTRRRMIRFNFKAKWYWLQRR